MELGLSTLIIAHGSVHYCVLNWNPLLHVLLLNAIVFWNVCKPKFRTSLYNFCFHTDETVRKVLASEKLSEMLLSLTSHEESTIREKSTQISLVCT